MAKEKKNILPEKAYDAIRVGQTAPKVDLQDQSGVRHRLSQYRGKWVVLYFYPKDDTAGCTKEACGFRDLSQEITDRGAVVLGVSPDNEGSHAKFHAKHGLNFDLLADPDKTVSNAYGVWQEKSMYGRKYMGVMRTTFLIGPNGKVAHRWDKVKVAGHDREILKKLDEMS